MTVTLGGARGSIRLVRLHYDLGVLLAAGDGKGRSPTRTDLDTTDASLGPHLHPDPSRKGHA